MSKTETTSDIAQAVNYRRANGCWNCIHAETVDVLHDKKSTILLVCPVVRAFGRDYVICDHICDNWMKVVEREEQDEQKEQTSGDIALEMAKERGKKAADTKQPKVCVWRYDWDIDGYNTDCDGAWNLDEGTPSENGMNYCPFCGLRLKEVIPESEE